MTSGMKREAIDDETLAKPFVDVYEGDRLALMYAAPTGEATTARVKVHTNTWITENTYTDPVDGTVPFWFRNLGRGGMDGRPSGVVRYRPVRRFSPVIRAHDQTPTSEAPAGMESSARWSELYRWRHDAL